MRHPFRMRFDTLIGYLPDGTMVVVEDAGQMVGDDTDVIVTNSLQTTAGRMIFAKLGDTVGVERARRS